MSRNFENWIKSYIEYASYSEAPPHMHFWAAVSAIAGALRRKVWIDMGYFRWHTNHYIIFVAPPGIVSKSTTAGISMKLLKRVPGINFGPDVVTWPALVTAFAAVSESFEYDGEWHAQCAMTLESSEFGNLVNPQDREMVDLLVTLWDGKDGAFSKKTKSSGNDSVENPWINLIACTTPSWIAGNFPEYMIGGGFTSRCLFIYADTKEKLVAYPHLHVPRNLRAQQDLLVQDLEHISVSLAGPFHLTPAALAWGEAWYQLHYANPPPSLANDDRFGGYLARKQTHLHKLAMVLSASERDDLSINEQDLELADRAITMLERDMPKVFARIGRSEDSVNAEKFIKLIHQRKVLSYEQAYQACHAHFPTADAFASVVKGAIQAGYIEMISTQHGMMLEARQAMI